MPAYTLNGIKGVKMEANKNRQRNEGARDNKVTKPKKVSIPEDTIIKVRSNFFGSIHYKNLITQTKIKWKRQGDIQLMPLRELRAMRMAQPGFFEKRWIAIEGVADGEECEATVYDICKSLEIIEFYKNSINPGEFAKACLWSDREIEDNVSMMSPAMKENFIVALNTYIADGRLDSLRRIKAFERALECDLRSLA